MTNVDQISEGIYRISTFNEAIGFSFNQFVIKDERLTLVHTGSAQQFPATLQAMRTIIDPAQIRYIVISHFESDECGALAKFLQTAANAVPVCSAVSARQLSGFDICTNAEVKHPGDTLDLGTRKLRFIAYPSEPHLWEGILPYEETERVLFSADLFVQRGSAKEPIVKGKRERVLDIARQSIPSDELRQACLAAIKGLDIDIVAVGHGPAFDLR